MAVRVRGVPEIWPLVARSAAAHEPLLWHVYDCPKCGQKVAFLPSQTENTCAACQTLVVRDG